MSRFIRASRFDWGYLIVLGLSLPTLSPLVGPAYLSSHDGLHHLFQLLDQGGRIWGQKDGVPGGAQLPTTSWVEGEIIEDEYEIEVSRDALAGEYVLEVGMYQWEGGERLPVSDQHGTPQADRILVSAGRALS